MFTKATPPTITELIALQNIGAVGTIELRSWLAELYPEFKKARRADVDQAIEEIGSRMQEEAAVLEQWEYLGEDED